MIQKTGVTRLARILNSGSFFSSPANDAFPIRLPAS